MKLFQQMLVAGASLSLIAPIGAQASNVVNLEEMNSYSRSKPKPVKFDKNTFINKVNDETASLELPEANLNKFEAGTFSSTTSMDGKLEYWVGSVDGGNEISSHEAVEAGYAYTMNLNTSFSGDDNLYVRLKGGDVGGDGDSIWDIKPTYHISTKDYDDRMTVDKIWYTGTIGDSITYFIGPKIENYYMYITPSIYKPGALKSMKLGGNSNFGASTDVGFGVKYEADNGFGFATNVVTKDGNSTDGILGKTDINKWDTQVAYTTDNWHVSATLSNQQGWTSHGYNATTKAKAIGGSGDATGYAFRGYWKPDSSGSATPEISVGYDTREADDGVGAGAAKASDSYFIGLTWKDIFQADDKIGFAVTQPLKVTECNGTCSNPDVDPFIWEAYYAFRPNDSIEVKPAIFAGTDALADTEDDLFGAVVTTTFKF